MFSSVRGQRKSTEKNNFETSQGSDKKFQNDIKERSILSGKNLPVACLDRLSSKSLSKLVFHWKNVPVCVNDVIIL